jgi:hypothetical protein
MSSFTDKFLKVSLDERPLLVEEERQRRVIGTPDAYVVVPVLVPKMSSVVQGAIAEYEMFWLLGLPGPIEHPKRPGTKAREAINFQCAREETAEDMAYMFNQARLHREMHDNVKKELERVQLPQDFETTPVEDVLTVGA